jgi:hypothetical protein
VQTTQLTLSAGPVGHWIGKFDKVFTRSPTRTQGEMALLVGHARSRSVSKGRELKANDIELRKETYETHLMEKTLRGQSRVNHCTVLTTLDPYITRVCQLLFSSANLNC